MEGGTGGGSILRLWSGFFWSCFSGASIAGSEAAGKGWGWGVRAFFFED